MKRRKLFPEAPLHNMKLKHWIRIIIFALVAGAIILAAAIFLSVPEARDVTGMYGFYKEKENSMDVILIGPSTMYTDFYSPLAYEEAGFTSYAVATGGLSGEMYQYAVKEALQTQSPSLFVVDLSGFCDIDQRDSAAMRRFADSIKKGSNRDAFIAEMVPEDEQESYKIPFLKYHSGWVRARGCFKALKDKLAMNRRGYSVTKNFCAYADFAEGKPKNGTYELSEAGMESLKDFLVFLKDNHIENVLFIRCPNRNIAKKGDSLLQAEEMIKTAGFDYLDTVEALAPSVSAEESAPETADAADAPAKREAPELLDFNKDFYDADHLNIYGAEKFTRYFSQELVSTYKINTVHDDDVKQQWDACADHNGKVFEKTKRLTDEHYHEGLYTQSDFLN